MKEMMARALVMVENCILVEVGGGGFDIEEVLVVVVVEVDRIGCLLGLTAVDDDEEREVEVRSGGFIYSSWLL